MNPWDLPPTRQHEVLVEVGDKRASAPNHFWWATPGAWATWIVGERAVSIWIAGAGKTFPEVAAPIMAVLWDPAKKVDTRLGEMPCSTAEEKLAVWNWLMQNSSTAA